METLSKTFPPFNEVMKKVRELKKKEYKAQIKIAVLRNSTLERVVPFLEYLLLGEGIKPDFYFSEYDNYYQELLNPNGGLKKFAPDIIILSLDSRMELSEIFDEYNSLNKEDVASKIDETKEKIEKILGNIKNEYKIPVILHGFEVPAYPSLSLYDSQNIHGQVNSVRRLNLNLVELCNIIPGTYFLDMDLVLNRAGGSNEIDNRFWHLEKNPYTHNVLKEIAREHSAFILSLRGKIKKCLIVDLDNTLWGGIIGEDGFDGIKLGNTYPGSAFVEFQQAIFNLYKRGIILGICSKNNEADILEVLKNHPDMVLKENHFSIMKVNWNNKAQNIKEIAKELNIGLDSIVFVDDNPFEINLIQTEVPEVTSILMPKENPTSYRSFFEKLNLFNTLTFSEEDKSRSDMYRQDVKRKSVQVDFTNVEDYLKSLEMKLTFYKNDHFIVSRVSQLSQRTNQFNLTTIRYSEEDIQAMVNGQNADVIAIKLEDRFGDLGIIGAAILKYDHQSALIDSLMISCRALGRNIEDAIMNYLYSTAQKRNMPVIRSEFRPTNKNSQVQEFYDKRMFKVIEGTESAKKYEISTGVALGLETPSYIHIAQEI
jgi:FkbH-like protein